MRPSLRPRPPLGLAKETGRKSRAFGRLGPGLWERASGQGFSPAGSRRGGVGPWAVGVG